MPVSPTLAEGLARATVDVYADAELALLQILARRLGQGLERSSWAEDRLLGVQQVRLEAERVVVTLQRSAAAAAGEAVAIAYNRGWASAIADLERFRRRAAGVLPGGRAIDVLVSEAVRTVTATGGGIVRAVAEVYRSVVAQAAGRVLAGVATRRQAAQVALDRFAQRGITGFRDRAGRSWDLASYSEMAVRTATGHAAVQGHMDRLGAAGLDLVIVSDAPQECERCRPWEGRVLSRTGATVGAIEATSVLTGRPQRVHVAGSLAVARATGLWHPNCRHSASAYLPGVTSVPTHTADPQGDRDRQHLRYLERSVRAWKRRAAVALDEQARRRANAKVRQWQAAIRAHVEATTAKRQPARERIGAAR